VKMKSRRLAVLAPALLALLCAATEGKAAQSPPDAELRFSTGVMHLREGRVDLALEEFKRAAKEDPKNPYFQKGLGQAFAAKRDWGSAISAFRKALELNPLYVDTRNDLGYALIMSGDRDAGKKEFLSAFSDPMNPAPEISAFNLGRALLEEKNYAEAANWFRSSLSRNKAYAAPYLLLAETLVTMGRNDEAIAQLEAGVRDAPSEPELQLALGRMYLKVGRLAEAKTRLEEALKADPGGAVGRAASEQLKSLPR
jgi:Flp pilus assembly protein TadD